MASWTYAQPTKGEQLYTKGALRPSLYEPAETRRVCMKVDTEEGKQNIKLDKEKLVDMEALSTM